MINLTLLNQTLRQEDGTSLLELMAVVAIIATMLTLTMPLIGQQIASREIDFIARRFIAHAQFARTQALILGMSVRIAPISENHWGDGWIVKSGCAPVQNSPGCIERNWISQGRITPIYFKGGGKQFLDPHSSKRGITFNAAGAAKSAQGGFVANRLILGHDLDSQLERHLILGSGGRWRICDPSRDSKSCR